MEFQLLDQNDSTAGLVSLSRIAEAHRRGEFSGRAQEAVDLASTADLIDRGVTIGYLNEAYEAQYEVLCKRRDQNNFSTVTDYRLNAAKTMPVVPKGGQYTANDPTEESFDLTLDKLGYIWELTWEDWLRDRADLGLLQDYPQSWGQAARYTKQLKWNTFYAGNATLFTAGRTNKVVTALTQASVATGVAHMRGGFTTPSSDKAPYAGKLTLVVPPELEGAAKVIVNSTIVVSGNTTPAGNANPNHQIADIMVDSFLTSATGWYLFCDPAIRPAFRYGTLTGAPDVEVFVKKSDVQAMLGGGGDDPFSGSFDSDNIGFKVRITAGFNLLDYRGAYYSTGAG